jgi:tetratricopeptide (TPR) repeat protein
MVAEDLSDPDVQNERSYDDLLVSIEANKDKLNLLIGVCDDSKLRDEIIQQYEAELEPDIRRYRVVLGRGEPSLRAAIEEVVENDEYLKQGKQAVLTVTGAEQLFVLKLGAERSEQEIFFGYLQWTREALREFPYSIVVWITYQIERSLSKQAPDFWSWRKGVFRFWSRKKAALPRQEIEPFHFALEDENLLGTDDDDQYFLPLDDLKALIQQTEEKRGEKDPSLATLYARMGQIYKQRLERGECRDYQQELALAIKYFSKAANLQKELGLEEGFASTLNNLAELYRTQGRYDQAEPLYLQALELRKRLLGEDHPDVATSLNNLAELYNSQGRYDRAEPLCLQALELRKRLLGEDHPDIATSLNNLALLYKSQRYKSQGHYDQAEPLYLQALELRKRLLGEDHPDVVTSLSNLAGLYNSQGRYDQAELLCLQALELSKRLLGEDHPHVAASLNNLAFVYNSQGRYDQAEPLYLQALELSKRLLGEDHPHVAASLSNLAELYRTQGRYDQAEPLYLQALELSKRLLGEEHPQVATSLNNLAELYRSQGRYDQAEPLCLQALELRKRLLGEDHPHVATSLNNLAELYNSQGRYDQAEPLFLQALEILERVLGDDHPNTKTIRKNLAILRQERHTSNS